MKKCRKFAAVVLALAALLTGCGQPEGPETVDGTTVVVDKNGGITYYLVGYFGKEYYSLSELTAMAEEETAEFNAEKVSGEGQAVTVASVGLLESDESQAVVTYGFDGGSSFAEFTGSRFFFGTVNEALSQGYSLDGVLASVKDGSVRTEEQLKEDGEKRLLITDTEAVIYCPSKVTYLGGGGQLKEDGSVDTSQAVGTVYILLK